MHSHPAVDYLSTQFWDNKWKTNSPHCSVFPARHGAWPLGPYHNKNPVVLVLVPGVRSTGGLLEHQVDYVICRSILLGCCKGSGWMLLGCLWEVVSLGSSNCRAAGLLEVVSVSL